MNTRDDITADEELTITVLVIDIEEWNHQAVARKVILKDVDGNQIPLTIFNNNDCAEFTWETGCWYKLKNAEGEVYKGEKQLKPSWDFGIVPLAETPEEADSELHSIASETQPDVEFQSGSSLADNSQPNADGGITRIEDQLSDGNHLLQFPLEVPIEELTVHEYQLDIPGGFDGDALQLTARAASRFRYQSDGPVTSNGPMKLYAVNELSGSLSIDDFEISPERIGQERLEARHFDDREKLTDLIKQDIKSALYGKYDVTAINSIIEFNPHIQAKSGDFTASREYGIHVWVDPDGTVVCGVSVGHHLQSTFTADEYRARGHDIEGVDVEHDTEIYDRAANGTIVGLSERDYTEPIPELGNTSIAEYHLDRDYVDSDVIESVAAGDPQLVDIDYGNDEINQQVLQYLRVTPNLEQLKRIDPEFHERFQRTARMLPQERFSLATSFVKSIDTLPTLDTSLRSTPTNDCYSELTINTRRSNFRYADGNCGSYVKRDLPKYGVHQQPDSFDVLALYPDREERESQRFIEKLVRKLTEYNAPPTAIDQETYHLGSEFAYATASSSATGYDAVLAVIPGEENVPPDVDDPYPEFKQRFGQNNIPSQMVTIENLDESYVLGNVAAGLIAGCGGVPWRIDDIPGGADCFIGLDVTYDHQTGQHLGANANVVYADGTILASQSHILQSGEKFDVEDIVTVIKSLLNAYVQEENTTPDKIVLHRDGTFYCDTDALLGRFEEAQGLDISIDLVEIRKSGAPRIAEYSDDKFEVANKGVGFVNDNGEHSYLATTGKPELKPDNSVGTPRPLRIVKREGSLPLETLTEQVYWLSEAHVGSISRSTRLPITTYYADRCAEHAREGYLLNGELIRGVPYV